jgi:hypothetical protein
MKMKIRINCTNEEYELCINNKKIDKKSFIKNFNNNKFDDIHYIDMVFLLYKNKNNFTNKSLEFEVSRKITEQEFSIFIEYLKKLGFRSKIITKKDIQIYIEDLEKLKIEPIIIKNY